MVDINLEDAFKFGIEAHNAGNITDAESFYTSILKILPEHPATNHNMGILHVGVGKHKESLSFFKKAIENDPLVEQFWVSYLGALINLGQLSDAEILIKQTKSKGFSGEKIKRLEELLTSKNNAPKRIPSQEIINQLLSLYNQGQLVEAADQGQALVEQYPEEFVLWNILGAANNSLGRIEEASKAFKKVTELNPNYPDGFNNFGFTLQVLGELQEAKEVLNKALSIKPDYPEAYFTLGKVHHGQGFMEEAIKAYKKALSLKPDYPEVYLNMGNAFQEKNNFDQAIEAYNSATLLKPNFAEVYLNIGNILQRQGKLVESLKASQKALSINPNYAEAYLNMGNAYQDQGLMKEAIKAYKKAISIKPDYTDAYWNLSGTANNMLQSKKILEECLLINPNYLRAKLTMSAFKFYEGDKTDFLALKNSSLNNNSRLRSFSWVFNLPELPRLYFNRWAFFDEMIKLSHQNRPFYEFGVWRGEAFKYLIKTFQKGYGFDTFNGLPVDWHNEKAGSYSSNGIVPEIDGGEFIIGNFEDTLPTFFSELRPVASIINFDADLYSSTICALNFSKSIIDQHTILIFDEFIMNENWEQDEYRALNEFCLNNNYQYEVLAVSFFTKQTAVRLMYI